MLRMLRLDTNYGFHELILKYHMDIYRYKIDDLHVERKYRFDMNLSICLESTGPCLYDMVLFKDTLVPKILCDWESDFSIPGKIRTR